MKSEDSGGSNMSFILETKQFVFSFKEYRNTPLPQSYTALVTEALEAVDKAYSKYSNFNVGVSVKILLKDGTTKIIQGSNQQNLAYPSGICGERNALFHIGHYYSEAIILQMAVVGKFNGAITQHCIKPCGACRQVILESIIRQKGKDIELVLIGQQLSIIVGATSLLPFSLEMLPESFIDK